MKAFSGAENVKFEVKGDKLLMEIDLKYRGKVSKKSNARVCSSLGNKEIPGTNGVMIALNVYVNRELKSLSD